MRDQIQLPKEHSTRNYVQMYINLDGEFMHFLALGKNSIEGYNKILDDVLDGFEIPHLHLTPTMPFPSGSRFEVLMQGDCILKDNIWIFNESYWRIGGENKEIDYHFAQIQKKLPDLEIRVNQR